jgi:hypothetical protein
MFLTGQSSRNPVGAALAAVSRSNARDGRGASSPVVATALTFQPPRLLPHRASDNRDAADRMRWLD